ncbi:MAG: pyrimidine 5'-nucleotidase [Hyphomicrobiales bacterium]
MEILTDTTEFTTSCAADAFADVNVWIFDLDNTLYPPESALWPQVDQRITLFLGNMFGIDGMSARALQKYYYQKYGTTLKVLMDQYGMKPEPFLDFAHDIDVSRLPPDPELGHAIEALPGRKLILTNGSEAHARNVAGRLGILHHFEAIFDIIAADFTPKPEEATYLKFLDQYQIDPSHAAMFEDLAKNLVVPYQLGMRTVLILPKQFDVYREASEQMDIDAPYIHFKTKDLAGFLRELI